jgi:putative secretion ATPase (PEP-CTERM system associated)
MYTSFYQLSAKPFQLKPDPDFFFGSAGHKRAMAYLEYGMAQEEGFIIITGEIGAGKTTLVRNLFKKMESEKIVAAQIANTSLNSDDTLRIVSAAFGLPFENLTKASLLVGIEKFLLQCDQNDKRALLVVDEAQNLSSHTVEELRMLSNYQTDKKPLLQTFLLGQPEFRKTLLGEDMKQLRQRVSATYHLGPMNPSETRSYIEHRLTTAGWNDNPSFSQDAFDVIYDYTGGIPRKINTLCERLLLMGCLEELHNFSATDVNNVIRDIQHEYDMPIVEETTTLETNMLKASDTTSDTGNETDTKLKKMDNRLISMENSISSVLDLLKKVLSSSTVKKKHHKRKPRTIKFNRYSRVK